MSLQEVDRKIRLVKKSVSEMPDPFPVTKMVKGLIDILDEMHRVLKKQDIELRKLENL